ncbi:MAG: DUF4340 domain-containing protein [Acidobacteriota bacterium]|nr:DUF4340 domain-containing protein [Acidobacteriota bacterium]
MKKSTLILLLVAVGLGVFVYFYEYKGGEKRQQAEAERKKIFQFKDEDISRLSINRAGETLTFERRDNDWVMTQPISAKADYSNVSSLITNLTTSQIDRKLAASADKLAGYGLEQPAVTLTITLKSGEQRQIKFGNKDFAGTSVYALIDGGQEVAMVPAYLLDSVDKSAFEWRDKSLLDVTFEQVTALELTTPAGHFQLSKQGDQWQLQQPRSLPADSAEVSSIVSQLTSARMTEVVAEQANDLKPYGLDKPLISAKLRTQKGDEQILMLGKKEGEHYFGKINTKSPVFKLASDVYTTLDVTLFKLRNKKPAIFSQDEITRIQLKNEHQTIVCEKSGDKWLMKQPTEQKDKEVRAYEIFTPLTINDAKEIFDVPPKEATAALTNPLVEVHLTKRDGQTITISLSKKVGEFVYIKNNSSPAVMKFEASLLDQLNVKADTLVL